jgi:hypothetical protein
MLMLIFGDVCFFRLLHDYILAWLALSLYHSVCFLVTSFFLLQTICVSLIPTFTGVFGVFGDAVRGSVPFAVGTAKFACFAESYLYHLLGSLCFVIV